MKMQPISPRSRTVKTWFDIHSHFLPGMDDGCQTVEESVRLLEHCRRSGIVGMIATPHYYPQESIDHFLKRRAERAAVLRQALDQGEHNVPIWCMGAEVAYYYGLVSHEDVDKLCLGKSRYMLLELPFERWPSSVITDIYTLINIYNITPIIAHLERYMNFQKKDMLQSLYDTGVLIQMNGEYILDRRCGKDARKRISAGLVDVLGSDTHNMTARKPNLRETVTALENSGMEEETDSLRENGKKIFLRAVGDR